MITRLHLEQFKSFKDAVLEAGPFTLLVGPNASGKSNLRDAFRLLCGLGRGYTLAETLGGKFIEGQQVWSGVRGGARGLAFRGSDTFALEVSFQKPPSGTETTYQPTTYRIEIDPGANGKEPRMLKEKLLVGQEVIFSEMFSGRAVSLGFVEQSTSEISSYVMQDDKPILAQLAHLGRNYPHYQTILTCLDILGSMRFFDLDPHAMREPSLPGQAVLSDRGENLSAVLHHMCQDPRQKDMLVTWTKMLTPMEASDLRFVDYPDGRVMLALVEQGGQETLAFNASDGTLRLLGFLAALKRAERSHLFFFEELEHSFHPLRLHLLTGLIEEQVQRNGIQVIATTHSPSLLWYVERSTLEHMSVSYRLEEHPDTRIKRVFDLPAIETLLERGGPGELLETSWLENTVAFLEDDEPEALLEQDNAERETLLEEEPVCGY